MEDKNRSTLFTTRSTENAMLFFTVVGLLIFAGIFLHEKFIDKEKWRDVLYTTLGSTTSGAIICNNFNYFKEGLDIMFTRLRNYLDTRNKIIEKAREDGYRKGYEAAKAEIQKNENNQKNTGIEDNKNNDTSNSVSSKTQQK